LRSQNRSENRIVHSEVDVKQWLAEAPPIDVLRPPRCPCCGAASRPAGAPLVLHGHGIRERMMLGPETPSGPARLQVAFCRRFRCTACMAVVLVVPRPVLASRRYTANAIALALALWGHFAGSAEAVRERVAPGSFAEGGWRSLRRWTRAVAAGALFPGYVGVGVTLGSVRLREIASGIASWLAGFAQPGPADEPLWHLAFRGGEHAP
jgi:hypothetical protein